MQSLRRTRPETLDDLTVQVAIVRPGPIQGGAINPYIDRRQRLREDPGYEIPYDHPSLEPVLRDTLGTIIFQDQVIEVAQAFAGFSPGEADGLRRAMSRKRSEAAIEGFRRRFAAGARRHVGAEPEVAERVWQMIAGFAGFGFPKSHSAAFGLLAYQSTWLRVHYGPEFLCALLNEQPMGFYASDSLVHEAERRGIAVLGVDVNASRAECTVESLGGGRRIPWRRAHRPRLRQGGDQGRGGSARGRPRRGRPLPQPGRSGRARRSRSRGARAAGVVGSLRHPRGHALGGAGGRAARGPVAAGSGHPRPAGGRAAPSSRCPWSRRAHRACVRWVAGSGWWPTTPPAG